jgi:plastocyanin
MKNNLAHMKKFLAIFSVLALLPTATFAEVVDAFPDVDQTHTYYDAIEYVRTTGLVNGNSVDGTFAPDNTLNRAEMLKILVLAAGASESEILNYESEECFTDVPAQEWFTGYVCYGKDKGYVKGYGDNSFKPSQAVTFVEGMKIAYEAFGLEWTENSDPDPWYKDVVEKASLAKYIPPSIDDFNKDLLRAEMADMAARIHSDASSETGLTEYLAGLGDFGAITPTYETIANGEDLSVLDAAVIEPGEDEEDAVVADPVVEDEASKIVKTIYYQSKLNPTKWIGINVVALADKDSDEVLVYDHTFMDSNETYSFFYFGPGCVMPECNSNETETNAEIDHIAATLSFSGIAGENVYAYANYGFYLQTSDWGEVDLVADEDVDALTGKEYTIINITAAGFSPTEVTVVQGDTVLFVNQDSDAHWPASDVHPNHNAYPGSDINNCGGETAIFDACEGLAEGATFEFTFSEAGDWTYHDHLNPALGGTVKVQAEVIL